jgi:predicted nucleic acid-binding protein
MKAFADTSYFIALTQPHDQWARKAMAVDSRAIEFVTSNLIISETVSLLQSRGFLSQALEFLRAARMSNDLLVVYVDANLQSEAWDLFIRYAGAGANAVDCASFAVMRRFHIKRALTFDQHFKKAGFSIIE